MTRRAGAGLAVMLLGAVVLAGCSDSGHDTHESSASAETAVNGERPADVVFAQGMIPHHEQALEMAMLVQGRTENPDIVRLAKAIEAAQGPEIARMSKWLDEWDAAVLDTDSAHEAHSGHGIMTDDEMEQLAAAKDAEFDELWLQLMIEHHQGAVAMSQAQIQQGTDRQAKQLAAEIIAAQNAEIAEMELLLQQN